MKKFYCLLMLAIINIGYAFGMYIESCSITSDEYGTSFDCNFDYFIWFICGIIILLLAIFYYQDLKKNKENNNL